MNTLTNTLLAGAFCAMLFTACDKNSTSDSDLENLNLKDPIKIELRGAEKEMLQSDQSFAFDFLNRVYQAEMNDKKKNFMVSPFSLSMALAMTWNGAANDTKAAMQLTLKMGDYSDEELNGYYQKMKEALLKTDPSTKLAIVNSIWTNQFVTIKSDFLATNKKYYVSETQAVDFTDPNTVKRINQWAADNTNNLIKEVLKETGVNDLMYLLNAIYFKGIWTSQFEKKNTSKMPFTTFEGTKKEVDMMFQNAKFNYTADANMQLLQLPYGNQAFSMMVLLPQEGKKLASAIEQLADKNYFANLKSGLNEHEVDVYLPKFKAKYNKRLNDVLKSMGMGVAFTEQADFSRMTNVSAYIDFVDQFTYIQSDEVGTEAAAVTVVAIVKTSMPSEPQKVTFKADRPFVYLIQENSTGAILFMGVVHDFE